MVYHGIFSSLLLYGSQIWGQSNQSVSKMEKLQNKALRIINFKPLRYYVNSLYNKCEILKFGDTLRELIFAGIKFRGFCRFWSKPRKLVPAKNQNVFHPRN